MKRKDFIRNSSGILLGSIIGPNLIANLNLTSTLNIGVIGTGGRGKGIIKLLNNLSGVNVVAVCDTLPFRLKEGFELIKSNISANGYKDYRKLLDNKYIDGVIICTPLNTHDQIAVDALDADKHVYCEKTLAKGAAATSRIVNKCKNSDKILVKRIKFFY